MRPYSRFQTLPGLLTGFFALAQVLALPELARFKPFQGFLPVSSYKQETKTSCQYSFKPFQGFLPVSSVERGGWDNGISRPFQTLPGLLTGFFKTMGEIRTSGG